MKGRRSAAVLSQSGKIVLLETNDIMENVQSDSLAKFESIIDNGGK